MQLRHTTRHFACGSDTRKTVSTSVRPQLRLCCLAVVNEAACAGNGTGTATLLSSRRQGLLGLVGLSLPSAAAQAGTIFDLPKCNKFKQAGQIQFCDINVGRGESPLVGDLIVVDYTARAVATGKVFDSSTGFKWFVGTNDPQVIPGWEVGILGDGADLPPIKEGGLRTLLIPPELAYGKRGDGCLFGLPDSCRIPPDSPIEITFKYKGLGY